MRKEPAYEAKPKIAIDISADGAAATVTLAADSETVHVLNSIDYGYSSTPPAGELLTITDSTGGVSTITVPVTEGGHQQLPFAYPFAYPLGAAVTIVLSATAAGTLAYLNVQYQ